MNFVDIILLLAIAGYCVYVLYKNYKNKKSGKCTGVCANCSSSVCHIDFEKIRKEIKEEKNG